MGGEAPHQKKIKKVSCQKSRENGTLMTQIIMIEYDFISENQSHQCHPCSIVFGFTFVF